MMSAAKPKLFFIGLGNKGNPMAPNLVKAGYPVTVFDVSRAKADNWIALGATCVNSLAEGAAHADVGPVQAVVVLQMVQQQALDLGHQGRCQQGAVLQEMVDLAKNPRSALGRAANHHGICAGGLQHRLGFMG